MAIKRILRLLDKNKSTDPIRDFEKMISFIVKLVGINDIFEMRPKYITIISVTCTLIFTCNFIYMGPFSQIIHLIQSWPDKYEVLKACDCISGISVPASKYLFMLLERKRLNAIFSMARKGIESIPPEHSSVFFDTLHKARILSWVIIISQFTVHFVYLAAPIVVMICNPTERYLPITPGEPFGLKANDESPYFELKYVIITAATIFSTINQTGYIILFISILAQEIGHLRIIINTLNNLSKRINEDISMSDADSIKSLVFCIKHYEFVHRFHAKIKQTYSLILSAHFFMMMCVLLATLQTMYVWDFRNTLLTGLTGLQPLFVYCFGGEQLITTGKELSGSLYGCGWENMNTKYRKIVLIMMERYRKPLNFTAASIWVMNRRTFESVVETVYKIYTVFK